MAKFAVSYDGGPTVGLAEGVVEAHLFTTEDETVRFYDDAGPNGTNSQGNPLAAFRNFYSVKRLKE